jgi:hypothetical protein
MCATDSGVRSAGPGSVDERAIAEGTGRAAVKLAALRRRRRGERAAVKLAALRRRRRAGNVCLALLFVEAPS